MAGAWLSAVGWRWMAARAAKHALPRALSPQVRRCRRLWRLLDGMHSQVFLESQVGAPTRFVLYFDPEGAHVVGCVAAA